MTSVFISHIHSQRKSPLKTYFRSPFSRLSTFCQGGILHVIHEDGVRDSLAVVCTMFTELGGRWHRYMLTDITSHVKLVYLKNDMQ